MSCLLRLRIWEDKHIEIGFTSRMQKQCKFTKLSVISQENLFYSWDVNITYENRSVLQKFVF